MLNLYISRVIPDHSVTTGFLVSGTWIPDSLRWITDSNPRDCGVRVPQQKFLGFRIPPVKVSRFRNPEFLTGGDLYSKYVACVAGVKRGRRRGNLGARERAREKGNVPLLSRARSRALNSLTLPFRMPATQATKYVSFRTFTKLE